MASRTAICHASPLVGPALAEASNADFAAFPSTPLQARRLCWISQADSAAPVAIWRCMLSMAAISAALPEAMACASAAVLGLQTGPWQQPFLGKSALLLLTSARTATAESTASEPLRDMESGTGCVPSSLGEDAAAVGALLLAAKRLLRSLCCKSHGGAASRVISSRQTPILGQFCPAASKRKVCPGPDCSAVATGPHLRTTVRCPLGNLRTND